MNRIFSSHNNFWFNEFELKCDVIPFDFLFHRLFFLCFCGFFFFVCVFFFVADFFCEMHDVMTTYHIWKLVGTASVMSCVWCFGRG